MRWILRLILLLNVSYCDHYVLKFLTSGRCSLFADEVLFLDFECKKFITGNKKCCLP
jgi:hypothetical protein